MKLRLKIIISTLLIILLIIGGSYLVIMDIQKNMIEGEFRDKGYILVNHLATELSTPLLVNSLMDIKNYIDNMKSSYADIEYIYVTDSQGVVLVHTFDKGFPVALKNMTKPSNISEYVFETERGVIHEFDAPLFKNIGYVHLGLSENRVREQINKASRELLMIALLAVLMGGVFTFVIGRKLTSPITKLTEGANKINKGMLNYRIDIDTKDEFGELARTFNDMASSLDQKINELIASKQEVENAEAYLETLFNSIEEGIVVLNTNHEIIKCNTSFLRMMGFDEDVTGKTCHEIISTKECPLDEIIAKGKPARFVHELEIKGNKKILEINSTTFLDKKHGKNIILVLRDVTQEKKLEREIILRNKELTILNEISRNISESLDLNKILSKTLEGLLKLTRMESGDVYIKNKTGEFEHKLHIGKKSEIMLIKNIDEVKIIEYDDSLVEIPLKSKDKVLGVILLKSRTRKVRRKPRSHDV